LPLSDEVSAALLDKQGPFGRILEAVLALEQGDFDSEALTALAPPADAYLAALDWANQAMVALGPG
jgi:c-di-GMP-related signal transduction protein